MSDKNVRSFYDRLDKEVASAEYVAGNCFSIADITLITAIDFASEMVDLKPQNKLENLARWFSAVSSRSSMKIK